MATDSVTSRNPLQREGTSQDRRLPEALDILYAKMDDRDLYDYLDFAYKYSDIVRYIPSEGTDAGNEASELSWQIFFSSGIILLSHISKNSSVESNRTFKADLYDLEPTNAKTESENIEKNLLNYFEKLRTWYSRFPAEDNFKEVLKGIIQDSYFSSLEETVKKNRQDFLSGTNELKDLIENYLYVNSEIIRYFDGLVQEAEKELQLRLANDKFTPHTGLLLTFLNLFEKSRDNMNELTGRHLRFHYEDILQIQKKDFVEDQAHILVQLAKNIEEHEIEEGTLFKGGKDSEGNELLYELTEEFIAGTDVVSEIKSSFHYEDPDNDTSEIKAAENALLLDGKETPLPEDDPRWSPFLNTSYDLARIGFAVSSPILRLKSGTRDITFTFTFAEGSDLNDFSASDFSIEYSTTNKWISIDPTSVTPDDNILLITTDLPETADPVTDYSSTNMEDSENFSTEWPVFKFTLTKGAHKKKDVLVSSKLEDWSIEVDVKNLNDAVIQNDLGTLKIEKPFMPFGPQPAVGNQLYIGHPEALSKNITSLKLKWDWVDAPSKISDYYKSYSETPPQFQAKLSFLSDKKWVDSYTYALNSGDNIISELNLALGSQNTFEEEEEFKAFTNELSHGFVKLKLSSPAMAFGHREYPKLHQKAVIAAGNLLNPNEDLLNQLEQPYTPVWENLTLSYKSKVDNKADKDNMKLFMLEEFGHQSTSKQLVNGFDGKGRLFIGLENVKKNSSVSLLLQFAEGTADPFSTATSSYKWFFLGSNGWEKFEEENITKDTTEDLLQSGIVRFAMKNFSLNNSLMPSDKVWLKLEVYNDPKLFNDFVSIQTQATTVKFQNNSNTLEHLETANSAGSISKLKIKDPAIKAITQPFASFGGAPTEDDESYTIRVSERLRHKDRAIQIWDYERLVLENFPEVYKAKCLNQTGRLCADEDSKQVDYSEVSPGDVTIVVIPDLTNGDLHNLRTPAVKVATHKKIKDFLEDRCSKWVNLEVRNPKYEILDVTFKVKFYEEITNTGFYLNKLKEDIDAFLTPWANDMGRLTLGNRIYKSTILNFVEERDYVDYLINFDAKLTVDEKEKVFEEEIIPSSSLSLIVPGTNHDIKLITE